MITVSDAINTKETDRMVNTANSAQNLFTAHDGERFPLPGASGSVSPTHPGSRLREQESGFVITPWHGGEGNANEFYP